VQKRVFISSTPVFSGISAGVTCSVTVLKQAAARLAWRARGVLISGDSVRLAASRVRDIHGCCSWMNGQRQSACCACRQQRQFFSLVNLKTVDETPNFLSWLLALRNRSSWRVSRHDWSVCWPTGGRGSDKRSFVSVMEIPTLGNTAATTPWACSPDRGWISSQSGRSLACWDSGAELENAYLFFCDESFLHVVVWGWPHAGRRDGFCEST
jgi:hypothetical protein